MDVRYKMLKYCAEDIFFVKYFSNCYQIKYDHFFRETDSVLNPKVHSKPKSLSGYFVSSFCPITKYSGISFLAN